MRRLHKIIGLIFAALLFIIAATGCLLIFTESLNLHGHKTIDVRAQIADYRGALEETLIKYPDSRIRTIYIPRANGTEDKSWFVFMERSDFDGRWIIELDPYKGTVIDEYAYDSTVFSWVFKLHTGTIAGGIGGLLFWLAAVVLFFLGISGSWIYRKGILKSFTPKYLLKNWKKPTILHSTLGIWSLAFILLLSSTGAFLMYLVVPSKLKPSAPIVTMTPAQILNIPYLPDIHKNVEASVPGSRIASISFSLSDPKSKAIIFTLLNRKNWPWEKWSRVIVNGADGSIEKIELPEDASFYRNLVMTAVSLHFGFYGSKATQWIYFFFGFLILLMPLSGTLIYWKRRTRRKQVDS